MVKELTTISVEKATAGAKRREIPDGRIGSLYLIVQANGKKSWAYRFTLRGVHRKLTFGSFPAISLKEARELAGKAKDAVAAGRDPALEKKLARTLPASGGDFVEDVVARFLVQHARRNLKTSTAVEVERLLVKEIVAPWRGRYLADITRGDIHKVLDSIVDRKAPITANRVLSWLKKLFAWAIDRDLVSADPCARIKPPSIEKPRDRVLSDDEIKALWHAAESLAPPYKQFAQLLILTGQRRNEVSNLSWGELDLDRKTWALPGARAKNGREHEIPLSDQAADIIRSLPRTCDWVLPSANGRPINSHGNLKHWLDEAMPRGTPPWVLHDIRRTVASGMARLGVGLPAIEKCLNHVGGSFGGIVSVYQKHTFEPEKRAAMATWSNFVQSLVTDAPPNVIPMRAAN
jgi:integrase